jgi:hypothetical protein
MLHIYVNRDHYIYCVKFKKDLNTLKLYEMPLMIVLLTRIIFITFAQILFYI